MPGNKFVWYELMTTDPVAAAKFYVDVVGWTTQDVPEMAYTVVSAAGEQVGGLMAFPPEMAGSGVPPNWSGYLAVDDVDAMAERVHGAGGKVMRPGTDIPGIGRFAVVADPQGAVFLLFKDAGSGGGPNLPEGAPGTVGWHELTTSDAEKGFAFYASLFGWTKGEAHDMGPMGTYQVFDIDGVRSGGMMNMAPGMPGPYWLYYFNVTDIDAAAGRVTAGGGKLLVGPMAVPGGQWILVGMDPQGAAFALVAPPKA